MEYRNFFYFVALEVLVVGLCAALTLGGMASLFYGPYVKSGWELAGPMLMVTGVLSPLFSIFPILLGALLVKVAATLKPEKFMLWSFFGGLFAGGFTLLSILGLGVIAELRNFSWASAGFYCALLIPPLAAWQILAWKYLRN